MTTRTSALLALPVLLAGMAAAQLPPAPVAAGGREWAREAAGAPVGKAPDITSGRGILIGGEVGGQGGRFVPWGGTVVLSRRDASSLRTGICAFNLAYDEVNREPVATAGPFANVLRRGTQEVSRQGNRHLGPGETRRVFTQAYLASGSGAQALALTLDAERAVTETNEANNHFEIAFVLTEDCAPPAPRR